MSQPYTSYRRSVVLDDIYSLTSNAALFNDMIDIAAYIRPSGEQLITFDLEEARVLITCIYQYMTMRRRSLGQMGALEPPQDRYGHSRVSRWVRDQDNIVCSRGILSEALATVADICLLAAFDRNPILQALYCNFLPHKNEFQRTTTFRQLENELKYRIRGALRAHLILAREANSYDLEVVKVIAEIWLYIATMLVRILYWRDSWRAESTGTLEDQIIL